MSEKHETQSFDIKTSLAAIRTKPHKWGAITPSAQETNTELPHGSTVVQPHWADEALPLFVLEFSDFYGNSTIWCEPTPRS